MKKCFGYPSILYAEVWDSKFAKGINLGVFFKEMSVYVSRDGYITLGLLLMRIIDFQITLGARP